MRRLQPVCLVVVFLAGMNLPVRGQVTTRGADTIPRFDSIAPQALPEEKRETGRVKPPPSEKVTDDTKLVDELKGLWFTSKKEEILAVGRKEPSGVSVSALPLLEPPEIRKALAAHLGVPVTLRGLSEIVKEVVAVYRDNDIPVVDVILPEQDITTGVVQILVREGRVGDLRAEGNHWFSDRQILGPVRLGKGDRILTSPLSEDLNYLNRNPFRDVNVYFSPGKESGSTDVILKTKDRFPVRFYAGYEDTGNDITAEERLLCGFNWGNAFGLDHTLSYQYSASPDMVSMRSHALTYDIPVLRDNRLSIFGSFSEADDRIPSSGIDGLRSKSISMQSGFRYHHQLPGSGNDFQHFAVAGLDERKVEGDLFTPSVDLNRQLSEIFQCVAGYEMEWHDPAQGLTRLSATGFMSPGDVGSYNDEHFFGESRAYAKPVYNYAHIQFERHQPLWWETEIQFRIQGQISDSNLLGTEQLGIGGYNTVRGYSEGELRGDEGWVSNLEFYAPPVYLDRIFGWTDHPAQLRFLGFWDYGAVGNYRLLPDENPNGELSSVGAGLRLFVDRYFSARMDYGFQLLDSGGNKRFNSRIHLGLIFAY